MKRIFSLQSLLIISISLALFSCSKDIEDIDSRLAVSSFVEGHENIVAFGSADLEEILIKAKFSNVPKLGLIVSGEMNAYKEFLDFDTPVYYAIEGPINNEGVPTATYAFLKVKDEAKLLEALSQRGFDIDESKEIKIGQDEGFAFGVRGPLAVVVVKEGDIDANALLTQAFEKTTGSESGGKIDEILDTKGDFVMGVNMGSLYSTSNTDLDKLPKDKQEELKAMVNGSYIQTVVKFEDGAAVFESNNFFTDELKERMFLNADANAPITAKLGKGEPRLGFAMNIDMKKLQAFMDEFSPDATAELARSLGGPGQMALMAGGKDGLAGLLDGRIGVVIFADKMEEPHFNVFIGLTKNGVGLADLAKGFFDGSNGTKFLTTDNSASVYTNPAYAPPGKLKLPSGCENFGKNGISAFVSFEGVNFDEMDLEGEENLIRAIKYITVEYDNDGGRIYIKAIDGKENILEQFVNEALKAMSNEISNMSI